MCAFAIALGTYLGGWRIIRTLGKGLVEISSPQGMAAESASAATILVSSHMGFALSTTHVSTGSILGTGVGKPGGEVRWSVAGRMLVAWLITMPAAGLVGFLTYRLASLLPAFAGALVITGILVAASLAMYLHSRKDAVSHHNVNDDWDGGKDDDAPTPEDVSAVVGVVGAAAVVGVPSPPAEDAPAAPAPASPAPSSPAA